MLCMICFQLIIYTKERLSLFRFHCFPLYSLLLSLQGFSLVFCVRTNPALDCDMLCSKQRKYSSFNAPATFSQIAARSEIAERFRNDAGLFHFSVIL